MREALLGEGLASPRNSIVHSAFEKEIPSPDMKPQISRSMRRGGPPSAHHCGVGGVPSGAAVHFDAGDVVHNNVLAECCVRQRLRFLDVLAHELHEASVVFGLLQASVRAVDAQHAAAQARHERIGAAVVTKPSERAQLARALAPHALAVNVPLDSLLRRARLARYMGCLCMSTHML